MRFLCPLLIIAGLCAPLTAGAAGPSASVLMGNCVTCHGVGGKSDGTIPSIGGMDAQKIKEAMLAFKSDERKATIMNRIAKGYTDKEIDAVSRLLSAQK
jgi:cytochrome c553